MKITITSVKCHISGTVKGQNIAQDDKEILSVALHISGTMHHMILINGTHV